MKKLLILLFSILISFNSFGEWIEVTEDMQQVSEYDCEESIICTNDVTWIMMFHDLLFSDHGRSWR